MSINIFSVPGLIVWLEGQDPETEYNYVDSDDCLLCRYFRARGVSLRDYEPMGSVDWSDKDGYDHDLPEELDNISVSGEHNYGAALARAKEMV